MHGRSTLAQRGRLALFGLAGLACSLGGCAGSGGGYRTVESANQNSRVSIIVIHHTVADFGDSLKILTEPSSRPVSSHYLIPEPEDETYGKERVEVFKLVPENRRAWHAGVSEWAGKSGLNDQSIGIELVNQTHCYASDASVDAYSGNPERLCFFPDFAESQIAALIQLLEGIMKRHPDVLPTHIVGHADIAPDRKIDPGPRFPWQRLAQLGIGAWYDDDTVVRYWEQFKANPLPLANIQDALQTYGYGIEVTGEADEQTRNVVRAFQMHFRPHVVTEAIDVETAAVLYALIEKYYPDELERLMYVEEEEPEPAPETGEETDGMDGGEPPIPDPEQSN